MVVIITLVTYMGFFINTVDSQEATFEINQKLTIVNLRTGETVNKNIGITNKGSAQIPISIEIEGSSDVLKLTESSFNLEPQEHKQVEVTFLSTKPGIHTGKFVIKSGETKKELPFILEVWSSTDYVAKIDIPAEFREAQASSDLTFRLSIISNKQQEASKVNVNYQILDFDNKVLSEKTEDFTILDTISVLRKISIPSLPPGDYIVGIVIRSNATLSTNTRIFTVEKPKTDIVSLFSDNLLYILVTVVIVVTVLLYVNYGKLVDIEKKRPSRNIIKRITKIQKITKIQYKTVKNKESTEDLQRSKQRLEKQLASLEAGYKAGYIKKDAYSKGKERLEKLISPIDKKLKRG